MIELVSDYSTFLTSQVRKFEVETHLFRRESILFVEFLFASILFGVFVFFDCSYSIDDKDDKNQSACHHDTNDDSECRETGKRSDVSNKSIMFLPIGISCDIHT